MPDFLQDNSNEHFLNELKQEKEILTELEKEAIKKSDEIEKEQERLKKLVTKNSKLSKELDQEREILNELTDLVSITDDELVQLKTKHTENSKNDHALKEIKQEKEVLEQMNHSYEEIMEKLRETNLSLEEKISKEIQNSNEFKQNTIIQNGIIEEQKIKLNKKQSIIISLTVIGIVAVGLSSFLLLTFVTGQQYEVRITDEMHSGYTIQNLKGDTIDTWLSWRMVPESILHVGIVNAEKYPNKVPIIEKVLLSEEILEIDDSLLHKGPKGTTSDYFVGWSGALKKASQQPTDLYIPSNLQLVESSKGEGEITIILTDQRSGDGYSGYTNSIADQSQNQILKSSVTIYQVQNLSDSEFETILRHELGHAFGLAHSSASEDLMYPIIETNYPYVSDCDVSAIQSLYDGGKKSEVVCEK